MSKRASISGQLARCERGTSAVEFAILLPVLLLIMFGILAASFVLTIQHGLQQLASESARAALAGMSASERDTLARAYVTSTAPTYTYLNPSAIVVSTSTVAATTSFTVSTRYDMSRSPLYTSLIRFIPWTSPIVVRQATIRQGGLS